MSGSELRDVDAGDGGIDAALGHTDNWRRWLIAVRPQQRAYAGGGAVVSARADVSKHGCSVIASNYAHINLRCFTTAAHRLPASRRARSLTAGTNGRHLIRGRVIPAHGDCRPLHCRPRWAAGWGSSAFAETGPSPGPRRGRPRRCAKSLEAGLTWAPRSSSVPVYADWPTAPIAPTRRTTHELRQRRGCRAGRGGGSRAGDRFALALISLALDEVDATAAQTGADASASVRSRQPERAPHRHRHRADHRKPVIHSAANALTRRRWRDWRIPLTNAIVDDLGAGKRKRSREHASCRPRLVRAAPARSDSRLVRGCSWIGAVRPVGLALGRWRADSDCTLSARLA